MPRLRRSWQSKVSLHSDSSFCTFCGGDWLMIWKGENNRSVDELKNSLALVSTPSVGTPGASGRDPESWLVFDEKIENERLRLVETSWSNKPEMPNRRNVATWSSWKEVRKVWVSRLYCFKCDHVSGSAYTLIITNIWTDVSPLNGRVIDRVSPLHCISVLSVMSHPVKEILLSWRSETRFFSLFFPWKYLLFFPSFLKIS